MSKGGNKREIKIKVEGKGDRKGQSVRKSRLRGRKGGTSAVSVAAVAAL